MPYADLAVGNMVLESHSFSATSSAVTGSSLKMCVNFDVLCSGPKSNLAASVEEEQTNEHNESNNESQPSW